MTRETLRYAVFGFSTTHEALRAEKAMKDAALPVVPIPAPGTLGALCGIAMRLPLTDAEKARTLLAEVGISPAAEGEIEDFGPAAGALT